MVKSRDEVLTNRIIKPDFLIALDKVCEMDVQEVVLYPPHGLVVFRKFNDTLEVRGCFGKGICSHEGFQILKFYAECKGCCKVWCYTENLRLERLLKRVGFVPLVNGMIWEF